MEGRQCVENGSVTARTRLVQMRCIFPSSQPILQIASIELWIRKECFRDMYLMRHTYRSKGRQERVFSFHKSESLAELHNRANSDFAFLTKARTKVRNRKVIYALHSEVSGPPTYLSILCSHWLFPSIQELANLNLF